MTVVSTTKTASSDVLRIVFGKLLLSPVLFFLAVEQSQDKIKEDDDEEEIDDNIKNEVIVGFGIQDRTMLELVGGEQHHSDEIGGGTGDEQGQGQIVFAESQEKDHGHDEGEEIEVGALDGALDIAECERVDIDKNDAEELGPFEEASEITEHEKEEQDDAGDFDGGTFGHAIDEIIDEIGDITADRQDDKNVDLPESDSFRCGQHGVGLVAVVDSNI
ncbi:MAG: hypothetical protein QM757_39515 [Paludibaculum sp.]